IELTSITCRAKFGDERCKMPLRWLPGVVEAIGDEADRTFYAAPGLLDSVVFGTGDGSATQFHLKDAGGNNVSSGITVQSIHQTDWQGRVELSSEARTNVIPSPSDLSTFGSSNMSSVTTGASEGPDGTMSMCRLVAESSGASSGFTSPVLSVAVGSSVLSSIIVRRTQNRYINLAGF